MADPSERVSIEELMAAIGDVRPFADRAAAGVQLAERLARFKEARPVVLAMPRGGVPVAFQVARMLDAPLDVIVARKLGAPGHAELGMGAVAEGGVRVLNDDVVREMLVSPEELEYATARALREVAERVRRYRGEAEPVAIEGRTVILVDDGLATGGTARAALRALRARGPQRLILAVPVGPADTIRELEGEADEIVCLQVPEAMWAIGMWYGDFAQVADAAVIGLLAAARTPSPAEAHARHGDPGRVLDRDVAIAIPSGGALSGRLVLPDAARGLVVFAHGSGSSRHSPRNIQVAQALNDAGFATLLFDLLTPPEERLRANVFDIPLLAERLALVTEWIDRDSDLAALPLGYFGASTGAAAALIAGADLGPRVSAIVSRGGRPDLAIPRLSEVTAPVLLIVGGADETVLELNRRAHAVLQCEAELAVVPGASHLFEEAGALEAVAELATGWFASHLAAPSRTHGNAAVDAG